MSSCSAFFSFIVVENKARSERQEKDFSPQRLVAITIFILLIALVDDDLRLATLSALIKVFPRFPLSFSHALPCMYEVQTVMQRAFSSA
jgi:hypothetical protein